ncbi:MAG: hypothetical protein ABI702_00740 [Burkholderiales bacterium]
MSIGSISFTVVNLYETPSKRDVPSVAGTCHAPKPATPDNDAAESEKAGGRRSKLVEAMMEALKQLGLTGAPATTTPAVADAASTGTTVTATKAIGATPTSTATQAAAATAPTTPAPAPVATDATASPATAADAVPQAVAQFAHALWTALQGSAKSGTVGIEPASAPPQAHHHHHHRTHGSKHGYDSFAQRLEALASASDPVATAPVSATTSTDSATAADPAAVKDTAVPTAATSPLADAFGKLVTALRGGTTVATGTSTDNATLLNRFLHTLAHALQSPTTDGAPATTGTLVNVTA